MEVQLCAFVTSSPFYCLGNVPNIHQTGGRGGSRIGLNALKKNEVPVPLRIKPYNLENLVLNNTATGYIQISTQDTCYLKFVPWISSVIQ